MGRLAGKLSRLVLNLMDEDDPVDEISQLEARIEALAEIAERCRKIIVVSRAAIAGGADFVLGLEDCEHADQRGLISEVMLKEDAARISELSQQFAKALIQSSGGQIDVMKDFITRVEAAQRASGASPFKHVYYHNGISVESAAEVSARMAAAAATAAAR